MTDALTAKPASAVPPLNRYGRVVARVFREKRPPDAAEFVFERADLERAAKQEGIDLPKNLGDVIYSFRYRTRLPPEIESTQPDGFEWIIEGAGKARYRFVLSKINRIVPSSSRRKIKLPDATPEIIGGNALTDEQALLAKVRYNRLIDTFLGVTAFSLQYHVRTTVPGIGQIEIDEVYLAVDKNGKQYVIPVQAKGGHDRHGIVQSLQDIAWSRKAFPKLICRSVLVQFIAPDLIAMFELGEDAGELEVVDEKHYRLVRADRISAKDLKAYSLVPSDRDLP